VGDRAPSKLVKFFVLLSDIIFPTRRRRGKQGFLNVGRQVEVSQHLYFRDLSESNLSELLSMVDNLCKELSNILVKML
jgi:hypothetical protein